MIEETSEAVFFRYSADCAYQLFSLGRIKEREYQIIRDCREHGKVPDRIFLEAVFPAAIERIKRLAKTLSKDYWDAEVIRKYFLEEHNRIIDRGDGYYAIAPKSIKELCKVRVGKIKNSETIGGEVIYTVDYGDKEETALGKYLPDVKIGERISTHWKFAIERVR